jgi:hypothetical protein
LRFLTQRLIGVIETMPTNKLEVLLAASFEYIAHDELRAVPVAVLKRLRRIPDVYLDKLSHSPDVLDRLPEAIQRQVWEISDALRQSKCRPLVEAYVVAYERRQMLDDGLLRDLTPLQKREKDGELQALVTLIGPSERLYLTILSLVRAGFIASKLRAYCALRMQLLMALHDKDWPQLDTRDPCHQFAWCLDACARDKRMDELLVDKLSGFLASVPPNHPVVGDLAMIAHSPASHDALGCAVVGVVKIAVAGETLPRAHRPLDLLARLLTLSMKAPMVLPARDFSLPAVDLPLHTVFLPLLAADLVITQLGEEEESHLSLATFAQQPCAREILRAYVVDRVHEGDMRVLRRFLPCLAATCLDGTPLPSDGAFVRDLCEGLAKAHANGKLGEGVKVACAVELLVAAACESTLGHLCTLRLFVCLGPAHALTKEALPVLQEKGRTEGVAADHIRLLYSRLAQAAQSMAEFSAASI